MEAGVPKDAPKPAPPKTKKNELINATTFTIADKIVDQVKIYAGDAAKFVNFIQIYLFTALSMVIYILVHLSHELNVSFCDNLMSICRLSFSQQFPLNTIFS